LIFILVFEFQKRPGRASVDVFENSSENLFFYNFFGVSYVLCPYMSIA
jgi:hypothetical protein